MKYHWITMAITNSSTHSDSFRYRTLLMSNFRIRPCIIRVCNSLGSTLRAKRRSLARAFNYICKSKSRSRSNERYPGGLRNRTSKLLRIWCLKLWSRWMCRCPSMSRAISTRQNRQRSQRKKKSRKEDFPRELFRKTLKPKNISSRLIRFCCRRKVKGNPSQSLLG